MIVENIALTIAALVAWAVLFAALMAAFDLADRRELSCWSGGFVRGLYSALSVIVVMLLISTTLGAGLGIAGIWMR